MTTTSSPWRSSPPSSFSASESPRATSAGRCASNENGWPCGQRIELGRAVERELGEALVGPDRAHLVGLPDEVGRRGRAAARDRPGSRARSSSSSGRRMLVVVAQALGGRVDRRLPSTSRSARWVNGENARMLSISSPKSSIRNGSRPVVGKTSTSPPRTAIWPRSSTRSTRCVAGERRAARRAPRSPARRRARRASGRRAAPPRGGIELGDRERRGADEPAVCEHVERAGPLADEVRRRLEPRADADAARREERDPVLADEPADRLGRVAGVGVVRRAARRGRGRAPRGARRAAAAAPARRRGRASGSAAANAGRRSSARRRSTSGVEERAVHDERPERPFRGRSW